MTSRFNLTGLDDADANTLRVLSQYWNLTLADTLRNILGEWRQEHPEEWHAARKWWTATAERMRRP